MIPFDVRGGLVTRLRDEAAIELGEMGGAILDRLRHIARI